MRPHHSPEDFHIEEVKCRIRELRIARSMAYVERRAYTIDKHNEYDRNIRNQFSVFFIKKIKRFTSICAWKVAQDSRSVRDSL